MKTLFNAAQTAALLVGIRMLQDLSVDERNAWDHFCDFECPGDDELDALCETINQGISLEMVTEALRANQDAYDEAAIAAALSECGEPHVDSKPFTVRHDDSKGCFVSGVIWVDAEYIKYLMESSKEDQS